MFHKSLERIVRSALREDVGRKDLTTALTVPEGFRCRATLYAKQEGVLSGMEAFGLVFDQLNAELADFSGMSDGDSFTKGDKIAVFSGDTRAVLTGERTALNFVQYLSGIATLTAAYVRAVEGLPVRVSDTRKTTPGLRNLEKMAVMHGGGANHRRSLAEGILIKENHIEAAGGISVAVQNAKASADLLLKVEVEVGSVSDCVEAIKAGADVVMLDNMSNEDMHRCVHAARDTGVTFEASGNATLERLRGMAESGVDIISVGALTHSAPAVDVSLLIECL